MKTESEYLKLTNMLMLYEKVLHPDFFNALKSQLAKAYAENKEEAFANAKISDEARELDKLIIKRKSDLERMGVEENPTLKGFT